MNIGGACPMVRTTSILETMMSTNELALEDEVQRLVQAEIDREEAARVERIKAQVLERQATEQRRLDLIKRIADETAQVAQLREQAAAIRAEVEPLLLEIERIEGVRPTLAGARSQHLEAQAYRWELHVEELEFRLRNPR